MVKVSILIPTMEQRKSMLSRLLFGLQHQMNDSVEVLIDQSNNKMGDKLTNMFQIAKGKYVVCVDDDDYLADDYVSALTFDDEDFVGYKILSLCNGEFENVYSHSVDGSDAWDKSTGRGISPKCLVKTEIAKQVPFGNDYTSDRDWSMAIGNLCNSGKFINRVLYYYDCYPNSSLFSLGEKREVGQYPYDPTLFTWV